MHILLVLPKVQVFLNFKYSFLEGFDKLGIQTTCYEINEEKSFTIQRKELLQCIKEKHITACLMINDIANDKEFFFTKEIINQVKCYIWFVDAASRMKRNDFNLKLYEEVYTFEPSDIDYGIKVYGRPFKYLPLTAGETIFCNHKEKEKYVYDISFIGLVAGCSKRLELLDTVAKYCVQNHKTMVCYGHFWHTDHLLQSVIGKMKFKIKHPYLCRFVINKRIEPHEAAKIYKRTRINLNIHIPQHTGFNCRTFEILGNGNFELCDKQNLEYIHLEDGKHIVFYEDKQELLKKIDYYLKNDEEREKIASQGGEYINKQYSFDKILEKFIHS